MTPLRCVVPLAVLAVLLALPVPAVRAQDGGIPAIADGVAGEQPTVDGNDAATVTGTSDTLSLRDRVQAMLKAHCASCHGTAPTPTGAAPDGRIGGLADVNWLASSALVVPGEPDLSRLFAVIQERHAPLAHFTPWGETAGPSSDDMMRLRRWIAGLPPDAVNRCRDGRVRVSGARVWRSVIDVTALLPAERRRQLRFLSFAHVWNACGARARLPALKRALQGALSGLSWQAQPIDLRPVPLTADDGRLLPEMVFAVDLDDLGIAPERWERVAREATISLSGVTGRLRARAEQTFATPHVVVAGEGFVAAAYRSWPQYADLLDLPDRLPDLARQLGFPNDGLETPSHTLDLAKSGVTGGARRLSRYRSRRTTLWVATERAGEATAATTVEGAAAEHASSSLATHSRALFRLPNGTPAFALFPGKRPDTTSAPKGDALHTNTPPTDCAMCHAVGPRTQLAPAVTERIAPEGNAQADGATLTSFAAEAAADRRSVQRTRGLDPVSLLVAEYETPIDLRRAAAELDQPVAVLTGVLSERIANGDWVARRLSQGQISRTQFRELRSAIEGDGVPAPRSVSARADRTGLSVWTTRESYVPGAPIKLSLQAAKRCYPSVINVEADGAAIVLYPNGFDPWVPLEPGRVMTLPPPNAEYALRTRKVATRVQQINEPPGDLKPVGPGETQQLFAFCHERNDPLFGIRPDYTEQVFTILGPWEAFLKTAYETQAVAEAPEVLKRRQDEARRRSWRLRRRKRAPIYDARPRRLMRDAATFEVR